MRPARQQWARGLAAGLAFVVAPIVQAEITLSLPVDCTLGETCYIQQYTDHDPGPGAQDFMCQSLSYDGHKGTDFALPTLADLANDVAVLAAADGTVTATRNSMPDVLYDRDAAEIVTGRECGNGVVLRHEGGWETQYCHLAQGSVTVEPGDEVTRGQPLGTIGLSGRTEFPHMQLSVRRNGEVIDPFAPQGTATCQPPETTLWDLAPPYIPGGLLRSGLTGSPPEFADITAGAALPPIARDAPLIGWALLFGTRDGDVLAVTISGPAGELHLSTHPTRQKALAFQFAGRRAPDGGWPPGDYTVMITLSRAEVVISRDSSTATMD